MQQVDREKRASRWTRVTGPTALIAAGMLSFGGVVAATTSGTQAQQPGGGSAAASPAASSTAMRAPICNPDPPEYPGCTMSQIASLEAGTKKKAARSYKAKRWGQKRDDFKKASPRVNRILKRAWRHARADWVARHPGQRLVVDSWKGFRHGVANDGCTSLGAMSSVSFWCHFNKEVNEDIIDHSARVVGHSALRCGGGVLLSEVSSGILGALKFVTLTWRGAVAGGVMGCISGMFSRYFTRLYD